MSVFVPIVSENVYWNRDFDIRRMALFFWLTLYIIVGQDNVDFKCYKRKCSESSEMVSYGDNHHFWTFALLCFVMYLLLETWNLGLSFPFHFPDIFSIPWFPNFPLSFPWFPPRPHLPKFPQISFDLPWFPWSLCKITFYKLVFYALYPITLGLRIHPSKWRLWYQKNAQWNFTCYICCIRKLQAKM